MSKVAIQLIAILILFVGLKGYAQTVAESAETTCPIKVGTEVSSVKVKDLKGELHDIVDLVKKQPSVVIFYRGGWCPYCNTHLGELQELEPKLLEMGYQILAVSPDTPENLKKSLEKHDLKYTLLSDSSAQLAISFGLAFKVADDMNEKLKQFNIDIEAASGEDHHILPVPAAVIIDAEGKVAFTFAAPDYKTRVDTDILLLAAKKSL